VASTLDDLRRFAVSRSLFSPVSLQRAIDKLGFVQADPIRAPARAQDLTLRHRVRGYRADDLERRYASLDVEEDVLINYGFVSRRVYELMHPRGGTGAWTPTRRRRAGLILEFVRSRAEVHPRDVDRHFAHGTVTNYWGGSSNATTHLLDELQYRGLLRVVRRERGIRLYAARGAAPPVSPAAARERVDALVDIVVDKYAPLSDPGLRRIVARLRYGIPQWRLELRAALQRARRRLAHDRVNGAEWYWPPGEDPTVAVVDDSVRLLAPFDPVVWDRERFERFWGWAYRFEAYTPMAKRKRGYYALPLLWRDRVIGWGNLSVCDGALRSELGFVAGRSPRDRGFRQALDAELDRMRSFLRLSGS
jgi:uncharacterized protein YcaQ